MPLIAPIDRDLELSTDRLVLEPITVEHAPEMAQVLSDPELYHFIPSDPPSIADLVERYRRWMARISPRQDELWLNWAARRRLDGHLVGHFQAGLNEQRDATIAYMVGCRYQRRGYALEALVAICSHLRNVFDAKRIRAWIDTRNHASIELVRKLGMREAERIDRADFFKGSSSDEFVFEVPADSVSPESDAKSS